jgi:hypothetical protein
MKSLILWMFLFLATVVFAQLPDPVGHWTFDEGDGYTAADISGNGNDGVIWDDGVFWSDDTPTGTGYSLEFTGKSGAVHIGDPEILQIVGDITLAAWIKTDAATESWQNIIAKGHADNQEIVIRVDGNSHPTQIWCGSYDGADHMVQSYELSDAELNTWIHIVGTYSSVNQAWSLYFNGEWVAESQDAVGAVTVDMPWAIGARASDSTAIYPTERHFEGLIDDVRIYNVPLDESQVTELYNQSFNAVESQPATKPSHFALGQNYPNPFNPRTQIGYKLSEAAPVNISVYNIDGQLVTTLVNAVKSPGSYLVSWNATDQNGLPVAGGIYIARMVSNNFSESRKLTLIR